MNLNPPQHYIEKPIFQGAKTAFMKCMSRCSDGSGCEWEFVGPRDKFQAAWTSHWREHHAGEIGIALTHGGNSPLEDLLAMQREAAEKYATRPQIVLAR